MNPANDKQPRTKWYKHNLFLILLNALAGASLIWGGIQLQNVWSFANDENFNIVTAFISNGNVIAFTASLIGLLIGGVLGYTLWAKDRNFPQSKVTLLAGIWAGTLGGTFISTNFAICGIFLFPAVALLATFDIVGKQHRRAFVTSAFITVVIVFTLAYFLYGTPYGSLAMWFGGALFGAIFTRWLNAVTIQQRQEQQANQQAETFAQGLMLADNLIVGDDGELVEASDDDQHVAKGKS